MSDRILGGLGIALAAFFIWQATQIQTSFISDPIGAKTFPVIIAAVLAIASAVIVLRPDAGPEWPAFAKLFEIGLTVAVLLAYAIALPEAGFLISTAFAAAFLAWRLGTDPVRASIAGIVISGGIYVVFRLILGLSLARGPLGF